MNRIKLLREQLNIKQADFAREFNVSQGTLSNWERSVHDPDNKSLKKMRDKFDKTSDYILGLSDDPTPPSSVLIPEEKPARTVRREDISVSFYGGGEDELTEDAVEEILDLVQFARDQRKKRNEAKKNKEQS